MHPNGANSMAMSGLGFERTLVGTGWAVSLHLCTTGLRRTVLPSSISSVLARKFETRVLCKLLGGLST